MQAQRRLSHLIAAACIFFFFDQEFGSDLTGPAVHIPGEDLIRRSVDCVF